MTQEHYDRLCATLDRLEAECGADLEPVGANASPKDRANRLLACEAPPKGEDAAFCRAVANGVE